MDKYLITIKGTRKSVTFEALAYSFDDAWSDAMEMKFDKDFPKIGGMYEVTVLYMGKYIEEN